MKKSTNNNNKRNNNNKNRKSTRPGMKRTIVRNAPTSVSVTRVSKPPRMLNTDDSITVSHTEFVAAVSSTTSFSLSAYTLSPADMNTFGWLSRIAANYQTYKWIKLEFEFRPVCGTSTTGSYILALDTNSSSRTPTTRKELQAMKDAIVSSVWTNSKIRLNPKDFGSQRLFVSSIGDTNTDVRLGNLGKLYVGTDQGTGAAPIGEVYVTYTVLFRTARLANIAFAGGGGYAHSTVTTVGSGVNDPIRVIQEVVDNVGNFKHASTRYMDGRLRPINTSVITKLNGKDTLTTIYGFEFLCSDGYQLEFVMQNYVPSKSDTDYKPTGKIHVDVTHSSFAKGLGSQYYCDLPVVGDHESIYFARTKMLLDVVTGDKIYLAVTENSSPGTLTQNNNALYGTWVYMTSADYIDDYWSYNPSNKNKLEDSHPFLIPLSEYETRLYKDKLTRK